MRSTSTISTCYHFLYLGQTAAAACVSRRYDKIESNITYSSHFIRIRDFGFFTVDYTGGPIGLRCPRRNLYEWIPVDKALPPLHEQVAVVENLWRLLVDCEMFTHLWKREKVCRNRFLITNHFAPVDRCMYHENSDRVLLTFT